MTSVSRAWGSSPCPAQSLVSLPGEWKPRHHGGAQVWFVRGGLSTCPAPGRLRQPQHPSLPSTLGSEAGPQGGTPSVELAREEEPRPLHRRMEWLERRNDS